jgi:hypothetical protein
MLPYFKFSEESNGIWFYSDKGKKTAYIGAIGGILISISAILLNEYLINFESFFGHLPSVISNGIIHLAIWLALIFLFHSIVSKKYSLNKNESIQFMFVFIVSLFLVLTLVGILFRGVDMELTLPWI